MIPLTLNNINWLLCEVPEGVTGFELRKNGDKQWLCWKAEGDKWPCKLLPTGSYSLVFDICSKMTEEQWQNIVWWIEIADTKGYMDYESEHLYACPFKTATQSGHSLLRSHGYKEAILIRVEK